MPFLFPHLALMPDTHLGKGATLGSVIPTKRAITPTAVGVDTGCGMAAVRTPLTAADLRARGPLVPLREAVERAVPLSAGGYNAKIVATAEPRVAELTALAERDAGVDLTRSRNWALQLGTLGPRATTSLWSPSASWTGCGCSCTPGHGAWVTRSPSTTPRSRSSSAGSGGSRCPTRTWPTCRGHRRVPDLRPGDDVGPAPRRAQPRRDGGPGSSDSSPTHVGVGVERHETINFHHNYTVRERHHGRDVWVSRTIER